MSTHGGQDERAEGVNGTSSQTGDIEQLQEETARTRAELGDTVDALSAKLDVRSRARQEAQVRRARARRAAANLRSTMTDRQGKPLPQVWAGAAAAVAALVVGTAVLVRSRAGAGRPRSARSWSRSRRSWARSGRKGPTSRARRAGGTGGGRRR